MTKLAVRELRLLAGDLVRRASHGALTAIRASRRRVARLGRARREQWRTWSQIESIFTSPTGSEWSDDRDLLDQSVHHPHCV